MPRRKGLAEDEAPPHYHGHRDRLREKFRAQGGEALPDYELLELFLFGVLPRQDTKPLAKALCDRFGGLAGALEADPQELARVPGCGEAVATALMATREAAVRLLKGRAAQGDAISSWPALLDYCRARLAGEPVEQLRILFLDRKNRVIADERQQRGTIDHTPVYPREVVKRALELQASALILVHNHPSGDPAPSRADIDMTRQVRDAAKAVGIALHDHVVIGRAGHASFRSLGLI